jgi:hypothetical protein
MARPNAPNPDDHIANAAAADAEAPAQQINQPPPPQHGTADARNQQPAPARDNRQPRRLGRPSNATISGIAPALTLVANVPFYTVRRMNVNTFIPSSIAFYAMLNAMDTMMRTTHRFIQSNPVWCPWISQLYCGILFLVQTLRAQRELGTTTPSQEQYLDDFSRHYDLRNLMVPGPLVPFLQALVTCSSPFEWYNDIGPALPGSPGPHREFRLNNGLSRLLPNLPVIMDLLIQLSTREDDFADQASANSFIRELFGTAFTADNAIAHLLQTPGPQNDWRMTHTRLNEVRSQLSFFPFPPRLTTAAHYATLNSWANYTHLLGRDNRYYAWFPLVAQTMNVYSSHFRSSVPLSAINPTGLGASIPIWDYSANLGLTTALTRTTHGTAPNQTFSVAAQPLTSLPARGSHPDTTLEETPEQISALALVNVSFHQLPAAEGLTFPQDAETRQGPYWDLIAHFHRQSPTIDSLPGYGAVVANYYHSSLALSPAEH